jgi:hypothetical protein
LREYFNARLVVASISEQAEHFLAIIGENLNGRPVNIKPQAEFVSLRAHFPCPGYREIRIEGNVSCIGAVNRKQ